MNINKKILSLPPYVSTSWSNVKALHMEEDTLAITLSDGERIFIPNLEQDIIQAIFNAHATYLEQSQDKASNISQSLFSSDDMSFKFGMSGIDGIGTALQHNPSQMNAPDIPREVLEKIASIAKVIAPEDPNAIPKPEPHCNCMHCQIARAIHSEVDFEQEPEVIPEEEITDEDLSFCQWEIQQDGEQLFKVTNRLNPTEQYSVFLGEPVGCTCGHNGCDHILAVLRS